MKEQEARQFRDDLERLFGPHIRVAIHVWPVPKEAKRAARARLDIEVCGRCFSAMLAQSIAGIVEVCQVLLREEEGRDTRKENT